MKIKILGEILHNINAFMDDSDRGAGHGIAQGMFYGLIFLPFAIFPWWVMAVLLIGNHCRVLYQELFIEDWRHQKKTGDFWFDSFFRPLQTDCFVLIGFVPTWAWGLVVGGCLLVGFKRKSEWPLIIFWK